MAFENFDNLEGQSFRELFSDICEHLSLDEEKGKSKSMDIFREWRPLELSRLGLVESHDGKRSEIQRVTEDAISDPLGSITYYIRSFVIHSLIGNQRPWENAKNCAEVIAKRYDLAEKYSELLDKAKLLIAENSIPGESEQI